MKEALARARARPRTTRQPAGCLFCVMALQNSWKTNQPCTFRHGFCIEPVQARHAAPLWTAHARFCTAMHQFSASDSFSMSSPEVIKHRQPTLQFSFLAGNVLAAMTSARITLAHEYRIAYRAKFATNSIALHLFNSLIRAIFPSIKRMHKAYEATNSVAIMI